MEANELRIGNLVNHGEAYQNRYKNPNIIGWMDLEDTADFDPIEISKEWALQLGLKKLKYYPYTYEIGSFSINIKDFIFYVDVSEEFDYLLENVKYVHQLQNLYFALTGEELIFKKL